MKEFNWHDLKMKLFVKLISIVFIASFSEYKHFYTFSTSNLSQTV